MPCQHARPVLARIIAPLFIGNRVVLPGHDTNGRALKVDRRFLWSGEREEHTLLAGRVELPKQRIDLCDITHYMDSPDCFEQRTVGLQNEVITGVGMAETLLMECSLMSE